MDQTQKLNAAFKTGDRKKICEAMSAIITDLENVSAFALKAGVDRTMLYTIFTRNLRFDILLKILRGADFKILVRGASGSYRPPNSAMEDFCLQTAT